MGLYPVATFELLLRERNEGIRRLALIWVVVSLEFSSGADAAPFFDQGCPTKKITLHGHKVKTAHVFSRIDPAQFYAALEKSHFAWVR